MSPFAIRGLSALITAATMASVMDAHAQCAADAGPGRTLYAGSTTVLGGSPAADGQPPLTYAWAPSSGLSATNVANPTLYVQSTPITYTLTVTDDFGCTATSQVTVQVASAPYLHVRFTNGHETNFLLGNVARLTYANGELNIVQRTGQTNHWSLSIIDQYDYAIPASVAPHVLRVRAFLSGAYGLSSGLMSDSLRTRGLLPAIEPYTAQAATHVPAPVVAATVFQVTGPDAIVDWVLLQARDEAAPANVLWSTGCLLQRDGDIVSTDGVSDVMVPFIGHPVHIAVLHRNHLGVMSAEAVQLAPGLTVVDLSDPASAAAGSVDVLNGVAALWPGDVNADGTVRYTGTANDRDAVLVRIGGQLPTNTVMGYHGEDVNLDGRVRYTGSANDRDIILQTVGGAVPTATRTQQLP